MGVLVCDDYGYKFVKDSQVYYEEHLKYGKRFKPRYWRDDWLWTVGNFTLDDIEKRQTVQESN